MRSESVRYSLAIERRINMGDSGMDLSIAHLGLGDPDLLRGRSEQGRFCSSVAAWLGWTWGGASAEDSQGSSRHSRQSGPDAPSGNPLLQRFPEPPRGGVRKPVPWGRILTVVLILAAVLAAARFLPAFQKKGNPELWQRAQQWLEANASPPVSTGALVELREIIRGIEAGKESDEARCALIALYGLGSLNAGNMADWTGTGRILERDFPDSVFRGLVQGVKMQSSTRVTCPKCKGGGKCRICGGTGRQSVTRLNQGSGSKSRKLGTSLTKSTSTTACPGCKGTGKCSQCNGSGQVTSSARFPVADREDLANRWGSVMEESTKLVRIRYWKSRGVREWTRVQQMLQHDNVDEIPSGTEGGGGAGEGVAGAVQD